MPVGLKLTKILSLSDSEKSDTYRTWKIDLILASTLPEKSRNITGRWLAVDNLCLPIY